MDRRKFHIKDGAVPTSKTFRILNPTRDTPETTRKHFEIRGEKAQMTSAEWFLQTNANDCGPCMILNSLRKIEGAKHIPRNVEEVRSEVNRLRRERSLPELADNGWFTNQDVHEYLRNVAGLTVQEFGAFPDNAEEVSANIGRNLESKPFQMVYSTLGRHFRAVIPTDSGYELLDSFNTGPVEADADTINAIISKSLNESIPGRTEVI